MEYDAACLEADWSCPAPVALLYLRTLESPVFPRYGINAVVEGRDGTEVYVTQWLPFSLPEHGTENPGSVLDNIKVGLNLVFYLVGVPWTVVHRCDLSTDQCWPATRRLFVGANGIAATPDRSLFFVSDSPEKRVVVLTRAEDGCLEPQDWIDLPFGVDNLQFDAESEQVLMGTMPDLKAVIQKVSEPEYSVPGGCSVLERDGDTWRTRDLVLHDGTKLSQVSGAVRYGSTLVLGSPFSPGILVCTVQ